MIRMHIVFAGNHRFVPYIGVAIHSILKHSSGEQPIRFSVLENGISESDRQKLRMLCDLPGVELDFKQVDASRFEGAPLSRFRSHEPYFRLLIPELFPESPRALYLDGDILVCDDVSALYSSNLNGQPMGACDDVSATKHMERLGLKQYFNSGVLLMDLELWRKENLFQQSMDSLRDSHDQLLFEDQDLLNLVLRERISTLDIRWNMFSIFYSKKLAPSFFSGTDLKSALERPGIIHFSGKFKPYCVHNAFRINWQYHRYAIRTPFWRDLISKGMRSNMSTWRWRLTQRFVSSRQA